MRKWLLFCLLLGLMACGKEKAEKETSVTEVPFIHEDLREGNEKKESQSAKKEEKTIFTPYSLQKTEAMRERDRIRLRGLFPIETVYGLTNEEWEKRKEEAQKAVDQSGYWDWEEAMCQKLGEENPGVSPFFPSELTAKRLDASHPEGVYEWDRNMLGGIVDPIHPDRKIPEVFLNLSNEELKEVFLKAKEAYFTEFEEKEGQRERYFTGEVYYILIDRHPEMLSLLKNTTLSKDYAAYQERTILPEEKGRVSPSTRLFHEGLLAKDQKRVEELTDRDIQEIRYALSRRAMDSPYHTMGDIGTFYELLTLLIGPFESDYLTKADFQLLVPQDAPYFE